MQICSDFLNKQCFIGFDMHMLIVIFLLFQVRFNSITKKSLKIVQHVDVAIKSYVISILTGSTFDGFIDCTLEKSSGSFLLGTSMYTLYGA